MIQFLISFKDQPSGDSNQIYLVAVSENDQVCVREEDATCETNACEILKPFFCERSYTATSEELPADTATCQDGWTAKGDLCYKIFEQPETRAYADQFCNYYGGQLAKIGTLSDLFLINDLSGTVDSDYYVNIFFSRNRE